MALDADDWTVATSGDIRWTGGGTATNVTVIELHRFLQALADDATGSGDDLHDITDVTSSDRSTDNIVTLNTPYNIDDTAAEHIFDGSITQASGATVYSGLVVVGAVEAGTQLQIIQDHVVLTSYWSTGLNADAANNILLRIMINTRLDGADLDAQRLRVQARELSDVYAEFSLTAGLGNSTAAIFTSDDLNNQTAAGTIATWGTIVNIEGYQLLDVDGDAATEPYYAQWDLGSQTINDLYERTKWIQRRTTSETIHGMNGSLFRGPTHDITYDTLAGAFVEDNYAVWGTEILYDAEGAAGLTVGAYYEFSDDAYVTIKAVGQMLGLDDDGTTGAIIMAMEPGGSTLLNDDVFRNADGTATDDAVIAVTITDPTVVGGRGVILADEGATRLYIQLISGSAPVDGLVMHNTTTGGVYDTATNDAAVNSTITSRTISPEFIGTSIGSAIIGAYGIGMVPGDTTSSDKFFDLNNAQRVPPNNVTFTVSGLISGEDRVLVGPEDGSGGLDVDQLSLDVILDLDNETEVLTTEPAPDNTPATGTIRVVDDAGVHRRLTYSAVDTGTPAAWTITTTDGNEDFLADEAAAANDVYITYIDVLAGSDTATFTTVFDSAQTLFVRVRDGGGTPIKTFETTSALGTGGGSSTAIRTPDA